VDNNVIYAHWCREWSRNQAMVTDRDEDEDTTYAYWCWRANEEPEKHVVMGPETAAREYAAKRLDLGRLTSMGGPHEASVIVNVARTDGESFHKITVSVSLDSHMEPVSKAS
jgi:hypothetical protein